MNKDRAEELAVRRTLLRRVHGTGFPVGPVKDLVMDSGIPFDCGKVRAVLHAYGCNDERADKAIVSAQMVFGSLSAAAIRRLQGWTVHAHIVPPGYETTDLEPWRHLRNVAIPSNKDERWSRVAGAEWDWENGPPEPHYAMEGGHGWGKPFGLGTGIHEAAHIVHDLVLTERQLKTVENAFQRERKNPRLRRYAQTNAYEYFACAAEQWFTDKLEPSRSPTKWDPVMKRLLERTLSGLQSTIGLAA